MSQLIKPIPQTWFNKVGSKETPEKKKTTERNKDRKRETHCMQTTGEWN